MENLSVNVSTHNITSKGPKRKIFLKENEYNG